MTTQKCIIIFEDGTKAVYIGNVQFDTNNRKRVKKVQFTVPIDVEKHEDTHGIDMPDFIKDIFGGFK